MPANVEPPSAADLGVIDVNRLAFLADGVAGAPGPFSRPAAVPLMPWIERPERGWIAGTVTAVARGNDGALPSTAPNNDGVTVKVKRAGFAPFARTRTCRTDGNGYFGVTQVKPGKYRVWVDRPGTPSRKIEVAVEAGKVARAAL